MRTATKKTIADLSRETHDQSRAARDKSGGRLLADLRRRIDGVDREIVRGLNERARIAFRIGEAKRRSGAPVRDSAREEEVLDRIGRLSRGPLEQAAIVAIYRHVISACRELQTSLRNAKPTPKQK